MKTSPEHSYQSCRRQLQTLFDDLLNHPGYADLKLEMRLLKRGQKEVILYCGKQYRYVIDFPRPFGKDDQGDADGERETNEPSPDYAE
ncbi:MAG: hypothetical protein KGZ80_12450 [Methylomonas sp.]|nr:hypothetical protein [Methylomonas sp.]